jgi:transcriptional regulator with XRE-family HTH domain
MYYLIELGNRIRSLRVKNNLTQEELALKVGYTSRSSINKIEKGLVDIPQSKVSELAEALGVTPTYILFGDDPIDEETPAPELTEGERAWLDLYRKLTPGVRELFFPMLEKFDELPNGERQMLLAVISAAITKK